MNLMHSKSIGQSLGEYALLGGLIITFCLIGLQQISQSFLAASEVAAGRLNGNATTAVNNPNNANSNADMQQQEQELSALDLEIPNNLTALASNPPPTIAQLQAALEVGNYAEVAGGFGELGEATYQVSLALQQLVKKAEASEATNSNLLTLAKEGLLLANRQYIAAHEIEGQIYKGQGHKKNKKYKELGNSIAEQLNANAFIAGNDNFDNNLVTLNENVDYWLKQNQQQATVFASTLQQVQANPPAGLSSSDWQTVQTLATAINGNWSVLTAQNASKTETSSNTIGACHDGC